MKPKKHTVNERLARLEKMTYKLALEVHSIVKAIEATQEEPSEQLK
jgi:hypothetical protein